MHEVAGAVDRVNRPATGPAASFRRVLLTRQQIVGKPLAQALSDKALEILVEIGDVAEVGLFLRSNVLASNLGQGGGLESESFDKFEFDKKIGRISHLFDVPNGSLDNRGHGGLVKAQRGDATRGSA